MDDKLDDIHTATTISVDEDMTTHIGGPSFVDPEPTAFVPEIALGRNDSYLR